jgi:hypothetical protein
MLLKETANRGTSLAVDETDPEYWPTQLQEIFAAVGVAMGDRRLTRDTLKSVRLPNDEFAICHVSAEKAGRKRGHYRISMAGGQWTFRSGALGKLSRQAAKRHSTPRRPTDAVS